MMNTQDKIHIGLMIVILYGLICFLGWHLIAVEDQIRNLENAVEELRRENRQ